MLDSFPLLLSSGMALGTSAVAVFLIGVPAALGGAIFQNHEVKIRLHLLTVLSITLATAAGLLFGGALVRSADLSWWSTIPLGLAGFALVGNVYSIHGRLRKMDAQGEQRMLDRSSLDGLMMDTLANLPALALLWVTLAN
jgi:hypothetical protein